MPGQDERTQAAEDEARRQEAWFERTRRHRPWLIALLGTVWGAFMLPFKDYQTSKSYWTIFVDWIPWLPAFFLVFLGVLVWWNSRERKRVAQERDH